MTIAYFEEHGLASEICHYNVADELPKRFRRAFDIVVLDPPWYRSWYDTFLVRARQLLRDRGHVFVTDISRSLSSAKRMDFERMRRSRLGDGFRFESLLSYNAPPFEGRRRQRYESVSGYRSTSLLCLGVTEAKQPIEPNAQHLEVIRRHDAQLPDLHTTAAGRVVHYNEKRILEWMAGRDQAHVAVYCSEGRPRASIIDNSLAWSSLNTVFRIGAYGRSRLKTLALQEHISVQRFATVTELLQFIAAYTNGVGEQNVR